MQHLLLAIVRNNSTAILLARQFKMNNSDNDRVKDFKITTKFFLNFIR